MHANRAEILLFHVALFPSVSFGRPAGVRQAMKTVRRGRWSLLKVERMKRNEETRSGTNEKKRAKSSQVSPGGGAAHESAIGVVKIATSS